LSIWDELGVKVTYVNSSDENGLAVARKLKDSSISAVQVGPITRNLLGHVNGLSKPLILTSWGSDLLGESSAEMSSLLSNLVNSNPYAHLIVDTDAGKRIGITSGLKAERITQIPWGVSEGYFKIFEKMSLANKTLVGGSHSIFVNRRHESIYQVGDVIKACHFLGSTNFRVRIAGEGSETAGLVAEASALGIIDRVDFLGWISKSETMAELAASSIYVNPSSIDGSSVSMLEAMAAGVLVVAADTIGNTEWVTAASGFTYQSGNVNELSLLLSTLTNQNEWAGSKLRVYEAHKRVSARARWDINSKRFVHDLKCFLDECPI
jgi:glycosyltransferase involved in cell wall biosynthesis